MGPKDKLDNWSLLCHLREGEEGRGLGLQKKERQLQEDEKEQMFGEQKFASK